MGLIGRMGRMGKAKAVAGEDGFDGGGVALGEPEPLGVLIDDEDVAVSVGAAEEEDGVVGEAVVEGGEPFAGAGLVKTVES